MRIGLQTQRAWIWGLVLIISPFIIINCDDESSLQNDSEEVWFRFGMRDDATGSEDFIAVTADDEVIALARGELMLSVTERVYHIHGLVTFGNGGHNLGWEWHFIPSEWQLVEESMELCDTNPNAVISWLESMPDTITSIPICPLASYLKAEVR